MASIVWLIGGVGCTVRTQKTFPAFTRHTLVSYISEQDNKGKHNKVSKAPKHLISLILVFF